MREGRGRKIFLILSKKFQTKLRFRKVSDLQSKSLLNKIYQGRFLTKSKSLLKKSVKDVFLRSLNLCLKKICQRRFLTKSKSLLKKNLSKTFSYEVVITNSRRCYGKCIGWNLMAENNGTKTNFSDTFCQKNNWKDSVKAIGTTSHISYIYRIFTKLLT